MAAGDINGVQRIATLDLVRGVAVLGILTMNIVGFANIPAASFNPHAVAPGGTADVVLHLVNFVLFDGKMRGLFSLLFGASMLLMLERAEANGGSPARLHYARMAWLFVFGLAHLYLIWWGDILAHYALVGCVAYLFRHQPVPQLLVLGVLLMLGSTVMLAGFPYAAMLAMQGLPDPASAARTAAALRNAFGPADATTIAGQFAAYLGGYGEAVAYRLDHYATTPLDSLLQNGPETLAYMLFGMAALRSGMLAGGWPRPRYRRWLLASLAIGLPCTCALAWWIAANGFGLVPLTFSAMVLAVPLRLLLAVAWLCLVVLAITPESAWGRRLRTVGRMAFTNYLATSVLCTWIFYSHGLGLFGQLDRLALWGVVLLVWAAILFWSRWWLARFAQGPLEWLWRLLATGHRPQLRRSANAMQ